MGLTKLLGVLVVLGPLAAPLCALPYPSVATAYDPVGLALEMLDGLGVQVPAGYTVQEAGYGELGGSPGRTDTAGGTISIDVLRAQEYVQLQTGGVNDLEAEAVFIATILWHEFHHTGGFGGPVSEGGYYRGVCDHLMLRSMDIDFLCEQISTVEDAEAKEALRKLYTDLTSGYDSHRESFNAKCTQSYPHQWRKRGCDYCA